MSEPTDLEGLAVEAELSDEAHRARSAFNAWVGYRNHLRAKARELGYALAVHGSLKRDIDILAFPWIEEAVDPDTLARALCAVLPDAYVKQRADDSIDWCLKPHGRRACSIHLPAKWYKQTYIDLSVAPLLRGAEDP